MADDAAFEGIGIVSPGSVLERFFARYVPLNSFTQMRLRSAERGEIKTWPVRVGCRQEPLTELERLTDRAAHVRAVRGAARARAGVPGSGRA